MKDRRAFEIVAMGILAYYLIVSGITTFVIWTFFQILK